MRRSGVAMVALGALVVVGLSIGSSADKADEPKTPAQGGEAAPVQKASPARIQVDLFELVCDAETLMRLNTDRFNGGTGPENAQAPAEVLKQLSELGAARLLARLDEVVDLSRESSLSHSKRMPIVQDMAVSSRGGRTPSISYQEVGCKTKVQGCWREDQPDMADISVNIELSNAISSGVKASSEVALPAFQQFEIGGQVALQSGRPVFFVSNDVPTVGAEEQKVTVTVVRFEATRRGA